MKRQLLENITAATLGAVNLLISNLDTVNKVVAATVGILSIIYIILGIMLRIKKIRKQ
jgi:hypothetical protein